MIKEFCLRFDDKLKESGRILIELPFNCWEVFGKKGSLRAKICINGFNYASSLVPRGKGNYGFFLNSTIKNKLIKKSCEELNISIELVESLKEEEKSLQTQYKRIIDILYVKEPTCKMCGQACVAMLAGVEIQEVAKIMGTNGSTSIGQIIKALDFYSIKHAEKNKRLSKENPTFSDVCILTVHMPQYSHWVLYFKGKFYDPEFGVLDRCHKAGKITSFLEIY